MFPNTLELSFSSNGEVGSVNVSEGDSVETGSILVTLDDVTLTSLEEKVAIARSDVNKAIEALDKATEKFSATPLEQATLDNKGFNIDRIRNYQFPIKIDNHEIRVCGRNNRPKQNLYRQCQPAAKEGIEQYKS